MAILDPGLEGHELKQSVGSRGFKTQSLTEGVKIKEISERCLMSSAQLGAVVSCGREGRRMAGPPEDLLVSGLGGEEGVPGGGPAWRVR